MYAFSQGHLICTGCGEPNPEDSKVIEPASVGAATAQEPEPAAQNVDVPVVETTISNALMNVTGMIFPQNTHTIGIFLWVIPSLFQC